jgi:hypothetical protein
MRAQKQMAQREMIARRTFANLKFHIHVRLCTFALASHDVDSIKSLFDPCQRTCNNLPPLQIESTKQMKKRNGNSRRLPFYLRLNRTTETAPVWPFITTCCLYGKVLFASSELDEEDEEARDMLAQQ